MKDIFQPSPFDSDPGSALQEKLYGPDDIVLVMDTSFLIRLANADLWANSVWHGLRSKAVTEGKDFNIIMSNEVLAEYEKVLSENRPDEHGIPFVHRPLEDMLDWQLSDIAIPLDPSANQAAKDAWKSYVSTRHNPESHHIRIGASAEDLSLIAWARTIASHGADVYVASRDFRDVIGPLRHDAENIAKEGLHITPLPPLPLEAHSFEGKWFYNPNNKSLPPIINHPLVADLLASKLHLGASTYVIFERNVKSGDARFDVAVDIAEFKNQREASGLIRNKGKYYGIPAVRLPHKYLGNHINLMRQYFQRSSTSLPYRLLVVDSGAAEFFPVLIAPSGAHDNWWRWFRPFHTTSDFLYHQTDSAHAKEHFHPNTHAAKRRTP